jgi:aryl-alcohol dehydrogenase-like predicted oxidoreductase
MHYRTFGRLGWQVSEMGYGMWGMAGWTGSDDDQSMEALHRAVELGCNFFDTAFAYGEGHSERLLGDLVRAHPDHRLITASKIPPRTASGRPFRNRPSTRSSRRTTSASTPTAAWKTWASTGWT